MLVRITEGPHAGDATLQVIRPDATVGQLATAIGLDGEAGLVVDGTLLGAATPLAAAGLGDGAVLGPPEPAAPDPGAPAVHVAGGLDAGRSWPLGPGGATLGRAAGSDVPLASPTVSAAHARLTPVGGSVVVQDLGSRNGTWIGGAAVLDPRPVPPGATIRTGAVHLRVGPSPGGDELPTAGGRRTLHRPPRVAEPAPAPPLALPDPPRPPAEAGGISLAVVVGPIVVGAAMVVLLGSFRYALLALLSPVLAVLALLDAKVRHRRGLRRELARHARELAAFAAELHERRDDEAARRRARVPDPAEVVGRAVRRSTRLWERRPHHDDLLVVGAGIGTVAWTPPVVVPGPGRPVPDAARVLAEAASLVDVPVTVDLGPGEVVGVVGLPEAAAAVARSLLCQVAVHVGPADVGLAVVADDAHRPRWDWATWLPHLRSPGPGPQVAATAEEGAALVGRLRAPGSEAAGRVPPVVLVVVDAGADSAAIAGRVLRGHATGVAGIVLAPALASLPAACTSVVELLDDDGTARIHRPPTGEVVDGVLAAGLTDEVARRCARHLARLEDPEAEPAPTDPVPVPVLAVLPVDALDAHAGAARWAATRPDDHVVATVGAAATGAVTVPLSAGPLVVHGPADGRSADVLRAVAATLAAGAGPEARSILLVEPDDGGALGALARLPHVVGHATRLDPGRAGLLAEVLAAAVARRRLPSVRTDDALRPQLVVVVAGVDEVAARHPALGRVLAELAGCGTDLGVHLVASTRERVLDDGPGAGSRLVVAGPGRATVTGRDRQPVVVRPISAACSSAGRGAVEVRPSTLTPTTGDGAPASAGVVPDGPADLDRLVDALVATAALAGAPPPAPLWSEPAADGARRGPVGTDLLSLLGIGDLSELDPAGAWADRPATERLRVPIGTAPDGATVHLDLKEAAEGGMGPHGLVVGATGSGKSELLRTLVTGLALTHAPEDLGFVLVDFKGGATFAGAARLPHVAGLVTNLSGDGALLARLQAALTGELRRRQELLQRAGDLASVAEHRARRLAGADLEPLPTLVVVIDEFTEVLVARPEVLDVLLAIGRLGRSLGLHLVLATQRLDEGRLRGLDGHLGYRVALRTFSAAESRAVLGTADAHALPPEPGGGYLQVGAAPAQRFTAALVTAPSGPSAESVVDHLGDLDPSRRVHQVWAPPLEPEVSLGALLPPLAVEPGRGLAAAGWPAAGRLVVPLGLVDEPEAQARTLLLADLTGAAGNIAIVGAPQSGTSTLLRTLVLSLLVTHTPEEVQVYAVDDGGGSLAALGGAPHVGGVVDRDDPERVRALVRHLTALLARREARFRDDGIDGMAGARRRRAGGAEDLADVVLAVDGWPAPRAGFEDLEPAVHALAARGLGVGIHVVVTAPRWLDVRPGLRDSLGGRLELRLAAPADSLVDRRTAALVPAVPGRGLTVLGSLFQAALPRLDGRATAEGLRAAAAEVATGLAAAWDGPVAPPVRVLPDAVDARDLPAPGPGDELGVPIGVDEGEAGTVRLDLVSGDPHLLVLGDGGSGRTTLLRTFLTELCARTPAASAQVVVVDPRRTLLEVVPETHLLAHAGTAAATVEAVARVRALVDARVPGPDVTARALRARSWWEGPELYVVVDDHDLVVAPSGNPLLGLVDLLAQGRDLGLHLVLARRVAGTTRAGFEPVLQRLRELGTTGLLLAGDPAEGPVLGGRRAGPRRAGRATLVRRGRPDVELQVACTPPGDEVG